MKKLLLLAAGAFVAMSANAQWAVVGSYTDPNWNFQASTTFEGEGDDLSCTIDYLTTSFKIVDITNDNWETAYGLPEGEFLSVNTPTVLTLGSDNIYFEGDLTQGVKNAQVTWNPTTFTLEVKAAADDIVEAYPELTMVGSFYNNWANPGVAGTEENGIYTYKVDLGEGGATFKLASAGWAVEIAGPEDGVVVGYEAVKVSIGGKDLATELEGEQTLVFDYNALEMWFEDGTGVESIGVDANAPAAYYNLNGVRVNNPEKGVYVVKQGKKTSKVVIR
ncbi:MAG: hypothetical protein J1D77_05670 [Muribaculaceae bacterium]|nr:hypothetical protein [Muribaculaceae bacterium]